MPIYGCYSLDLYCDAEIESGTVLNNATQATFAAQRREDAVREAREAGWIVNEQKNRTVCPDCRNPKREKNHEV
ncbi:MAG: hypothetical protein WC262_08045 [Bacteroidales bacterium]|jgi:hypothetical protein